MDEQDIKSAITKFSLFINWCEEWLDDIPAGDIQIFSNITKPLLKNLQQLDDPNSLKKTLNELRILAIQHPWIIQILKPIESLRLIYILLLDQTLSTPTKRGFDFGLPGPYVNHQSFEKYLEETEARKIQEKLKNPPVTRSFELPPEPEPDTEKIKSVKTHTNIQSENYAFLNHVFEVKVKLSDQPQADTGDHLSTSEAEITVHEGEIVPVLVKLQAPDFDLSLDQAGWSQEIKFYSDASASGTATFKLIPRDRFLDRDFSAIRAFFIVRGNIVGEVFKWVEVLRDENMFRKKISDFPKAPQYDLDENGMEKLPHIEAPITIPDDQHPTPSMTVRISKNEGRNSYTWNITAPGLREDQYPDPNVLFYESSDLGASEFVKNYLSPLVKYLDDNGNLKNEGIGMLFGFLLDLRDNAPKSFWEIYELALQTHIDQGGKESTFSILFITDDSFIPWELMPIRKELGPNRLLPPLLGSLHQVGRWLPGVAKSQPSTNLELRGFALAVPKYVGKPLNAAENARIFLKKYDPYFIEKDDVPFPDVFIEYMSTGSPTNGTGILHYSGHGNCCTDVQKAVWLELDDGMSFYSIAQAKNEFSNYLGKTPEGSPTPTFAFFNACKASFVKQNALGTIGGWARALLYNNYDGYVGPLWSVEDNHASMVSEKFYTKAIDEGLPLGEVMRQIREEFTKNNRLFTHIAYIYFGHPLTKIAYTPFEEE